MYMLLINVLVLVGSESEKFTKVHMEPDENGKMVPVGYNWDLFEKVREKLSDRYKFLVTYSDISHSDYAKWVEQVASKKYDMVVGAFMKTAHRETVVNFSTPTILDATSILHKQQDDLLNDVRKIMMKAIHLIGYIIVIGIAMGVILYFGDPKRAGRYQNLKGKEFFLRSVITGIASVFGEMGFLSENTSLKSIPGALLTVFMMIVSFLLIMFTQAKITQKMLELDSTYHPNNVRDKTFLIFRGDPVKEEFEQYHAKLKEVDSDTSEQLVDYYLEHEKEYDGCIMPYADAYFFQRTRTGLHISSDFGYFTSHWIFNKGKANLLEDINATLLLLKESGELKTMCTSKLGGDWQVPICSLF